MNKKNNLLRYFIYFIIFSFIGSLIEYLYGFIGGTGIAYDRTLYELTNIKIFFISFYGLVCLSLILFEKFLNKKKIKTIYYGLLNGILIVCWELVGGLFSISLFGHNFWDYSKQPFNFYGIISIEMFLFWVLAGYIFSFIYKFIIEKYEKQI
jgi:uncharacterized membrane protein